MGGKKKTELGSEKSWEEREPLKEKRSPFNGAAADERRRQRSAQTGSHAGEHTPTGERKRERARARPSRWGSPRTYTLRTGDDGGRRRGFAAGGRGQAPMGGAIQAQLLESSGHGLRVRGEGGYDRGEYPVEQLPEGFRCVHERESIPTATRTRLAVATTFSRPRLPLQPPSHSL